MILVLLKKKYLEKNSFLRFLLTTDDIISDFNKYKFKTILANNVYKGLMTFHILHYKCNLKTGSKYILNKTAKPIKM